MTTKIQRCKWAESGASNGALMVPYHDEEWDLARRSGESGELKESDIEKMLQDQGIIRSRAKIEATICGANTCLEIQKAGEDFSEFVWKLAGGKPITNSRPVPTQTPLSVQFSKEFKSAVSSLWDLSSSTPGCKRLE